MSEFFINQPLWVYIAIYIGVGLVVHVLVSIYNFRHYKWIDSILGVPAWSLFGVPVLMVIIPVLLPIILIKWALGKFDRNL